MNKISLASHEQIQKHPNNNSPAKISFKFPKTKRFVENNPECPVAFYTYASQLSRRKSIIGTQKRVEFPKAEEDTPGSNAYNQNNYYQFTKGKGKTFGVSRQKSKDRSYLIPQIQKHPGVGKYYVQRQSKSAAYSIRSKTIDVIKKHLSFRTNPGPGEYQIDFGIKNPKIFVSKYKSSSLGITTHSPRFSKIKKLPGPQDYRQLDGLSSSARYLISNHEGSGTRPFSQQKKFQHNFWKINDNPGPGAYEQCSQFGTYGDANYYKGLSTVL